MTSKRKTAPHQNSNVPTSFSNAKANRQRPEEVADQLWTDSWNQLLQLANPSVGRPEDNESSKLADAFISVGQEIKANGLVGCLETMKMRADGFVWDAVSPCNDTAHALGLLQLACTEDRHEQLRYHLKKDLRDPSWVLIRGWLARAREALTRIRAGWSVGDAVSEAWWREFGQQLDGRDIDCPIAPTGPLPSLNQPISNASARKRKIQPAASWPAPLSFLQ
jgi:hypothetical protein